MNPPDDPIAALVRTADRDRWLATLYAPTALRPALLAVHAVDLELEKIAATTSEPMLGEIRLAWWRERLQALDREVPAQPVLQGLAADVLPRGVTGAQLAEFEDAWLGMLAGPPDAAALARHVSARGRAVFGALADLLGGAHEAAAALGANWAAGEAARAGWGVAASTVPPRAPTVLRPLAGLAALGRRDMARAEGGLQSEPRATAGRQWLLLRAALTGR